jgi:hypothetical protein
VYDGTDTLLVQVPEPAGSPTGLTLTAPATATALTPLQLSGKLTSSDLVAGRQLTINRTGQYGDDAVLAPVTTAPDGSFSFSDTTPKRGLHTYTVSFGGDAEFGPTSRSFEVTVQGARPTLSVLTRPGPYPYGTTIGVLVHTTFGPNHPVRMWAAEGQSGIRFFFYGLTNANGDVKANLRLTIRTVVTVVTAADQVYGDYNVNAVFKAIGKVAMAVTESAGRSGAYYLHATTSNPVLVGTVYAVGPDRTGTCMGFVVQQYRSGAWRTIDAVDCFTMKVSAGLAVFGGTHVKGTSFRFRGDFRGDIWNAAASSPWLYLRFV